MGDLDRNDLTSCTISSFACHPTERTPLVIDMADNGRTVSGGAAALRDSQPIQPSELTNDQRDVGAEMKMVASAITPIPNQNKQSRR